MQPLGVNRVVIAVKDLERGKQLFSKLLGATFHSTNDEEAASLGVSMAMSWDAGIELVSPLPDRDSKIKQIVETRGEGLIGVVFVVDDVEEAKEAADELGIPVWYTVDYSQEQIDTYQQGRFRKFKEYMLDPRGVHGVGAIIAQIELSKESHRVFNKHWSRTWKYGSGTI
ncbi:MAG: VOC family protein [Dehalococcoidia bacterium]|nr:VOC family protein [Dehalococcoidia bacterium]